MGTRLKSVTVGKDFLKYGTLVSCSYTGLHSFGGWRTKG